MHSERTINRTDLKCSSFDMGITPEPDYTSEGPGFQEHNFPESGAKPANRKQA